MSASPHPRHIDRALQTTASCGFGKRGYMPMIDVGGSQGEKFARDETAALPCDPEAMVPPVGPCQD